MAIKCAARRMGGGNGHEHITHIKWVNDQTGASDSATVQEMVNFIDKHGNQSVYCPDRYGSGYAWVHVNSNGRLRYIQTVADGRWTDNLLALPIF